MENPIIKKLQLKPGEKAAIINSPEKYLENLKPFPPDVEISEKLQGNFDFIQLFIMNVNELNKNLPAAIKLLKEDGTLWVSYPKKSSKIKTDISRDEGWDVLKKFNLRPVSLISINDNWSSLRLNPVGEVKTVNTSISKDYVDPERRMVRLPEDIEKELNKNRTALNNFNKLSFTHKKEYVIWILEAKREETRRRRIGDAIKKLEENVKQ